MQLELSQLEIGGGTQPRVEINEDTVKEYAEAMRDGATFPPVVVFHDGARYWLADGFHRYHAHRRAGRQQIEAEVRKGTLREAILYSVGANGQHGLRRTTEDKRKAVTTMLTNDTVVKDDAGNLWSDNQIAKLCGVSQPFVSKLRKETLTYNGYKSDGAGSQTDSSSPRTYTTRHGTKSVMNTANIGGGNRTGRKPRRKWGGLAPDAEKVVRGPSQPRLRQTTLNIPHNPDSAARALLSAFGEEFARSLIERLSNHLQGAQA